MKLLAFLETLKPLNEGIMDAMIETAVPEAIAMLREELESGRFDKGDFVDMAYRDHYGEDYPDDDADVPPEAEGIIQEWMARWTEARVEHAAQEMMNGMSYNRQAHMDGIVIYRVIKADENFPSNITARGLGEYWSWEEGAAEAHQAGAGNQEYLMVGLVDPKNVNWEQSLFQNAHPSYDHERELFIPEGSGIELYKLLKGNGDEIDPSQYGGRQQLAASIGEDVDLDEGPSDFSLGQLTNDDIKDQLEYFYGDLAPSYGDAKELLGKVDGYDLVRYSYTLQGTPHHYLFLAQFNKPIVMVRVKDWQDGIAVTNVRSTGEYPVSKFYYHILKNISDPLYSGDQQTTGGRKIWTDLAKHYPDVNITDVGRHLRASFDNKDAYGESNVALDARFARSSVLREATEMGLTMPEGMDIVREIETGRGGIAKLVGRSQS